MIPGLVRGILPSGIWECTQDELRTTFGFNARRKQLLLQFDALLAQTAHLTAVPLLIDGSFVTDKALPKDIDICADLDRLSNIDRRPWEDFFFARRWYLLGTGIDFWIRSPDFPADVSATEFPRLKAEDMDRLGLPAGTNKGFLRLR